MAIYLNDHLAGATLGVEVARRTLNSNNDNEFGDFLRRLTGEVEDDRQTLRSVMRELDVRVDPAKQAAAVGFREDRAAEAERPSCPLLAAEPTRGARVSFNRDHREARHVAPPPARA
jgi:hypothetical protein